MNRASEENLLAAGEEIKALLKRRDLAGVVVLSDRKHTNYQLCLETSYTVQMDEANVTQWSIEPAKDKNDFYETLQILGGLILATKDGISQMARLGTCLMDAQEEHEEENKKS